MRGERDMEQLETISSALRALQNPDNEPLKRTLAHLYMIESCERRREGYVCVVVYESMVKRRKKKERKITTISLLSHTPLPPQRRFLNG